MYVLGRGAGYNYKRLCKGWDLLEVVKFSWHCHDLRNFFKNLMCDRAKISDQNCILGGWVTIPLFQVLQMFYWKATLMLS